VVISHASGVKLKGGPGVKVPSNFLLEDQKFPPPGEPHYHELYGSYEQTSGLEFLTRLDSSEQEMFGRG